MNPPLLDVRHLSVEFRSDRQRVQAVDDVSFQVQPGQTLGIVGESGSGKSVACLGSLGLIPQPPGEVTAGEIWFQPPQADRPVDLLRLSPKQWQQYRGGQLAMIFQEPMTSLNPLYSCGFQMIETLRHHEPLSLEEARRRAVALLQEVKLLPADAVLLQRHRGTSGRSPHTSPDDDRALQQRINLEKQAFLDRYPHQLSGGQQQRVMIAMALSCNPSLLIADEPTTALDVTVQATILALLRDLCRQREMALILVSHDLGVVADIADTVAVMYRGKIVEQGPVADIFHQPRHPYTQALLACRPRLDYTPRYLPTLEDFLQADGTPVVRSEPIADRPSNPEPSPLPPPSSDQPLLRVDNLRVVFRGKGLMGLMQPAVRAVDGISFTVQAGETLGLVGESGCGKTTLARALLRLIEPSSGQILFQGQDLIHLKPAPLRLLRREMQIIFQDPGGALDPRMRVGAAVMEPMLIHAFNRRSPAHRDRAIYLLERVGLSADIFNRYPHEFSGGQRQRVCIARALALSPRFIICDESVSALDVSVQAQVLNLLKELQGELGLTYLFISHDLSVVKFMSDRIMVMNQGRIEEIAPAAELYGNPQREYTRQLIAAIPQGL
ncbi:ABC transporter ATP-binding protein [Prochlorothrix hollandica]|uniref:ABC transporter ATP-binding protein n=1 Tax=Prochlorothrix hollandica TaxID=1223 RepID=UPI00333F77F9